MTNQQKWTLFSERMPEGFGKRVPDPNDYGYVFAYDIWVTAKDYATKDYVVYPCRLCCYDDGYFFDGYFNEDCEALAWMPLIGPEPYKD